MPASYTGMRMGSREKNIALIKTIPDHQRIKHISNDGWNDKQVSRYISYLFASLLKNKSSYINRIVHPFKMLSAPVVINSDGRCKGRQQIDTGPSGLHYVERIKSALADQKTIFPKRKYWRGRFSSVRNFTDLL